MNYRPEYTPMQFIELPAKTRRVIQTLMEYLRNIYARSGHTIKFMGKSKHSNAYWLVAEKKEDVQWIRSNLIFDTKGKYE